MSKTFLPLAAAAYVACVVLTSGCVVGGDTSQPVLAVDLYWDENDRSDRFAGGTCATAEVSWMEWQLLDEDGNELAASVEDGEDCQDGFNFNDFGPGVYKLVVRGYDTHDEPYWKATCKGLELDRFDQLYRCDIER